MTIALDTSYNPEETEIEKLSREEIARYSRHLILPEVGVAGQIKIKHAKVLLIGAGGLGSPIAMYLAAAGVGTIGLVDFDVVDHSNLQRQIIHGTEDVGKPKLESAKNTLHSINPLVQVNTHNVALTSTNALEILGNYDIVVDGTDNFPTRYLVNDAAVLLGIPAVYGSIFRFEGQASVFYAKEGPCYRCLYTEPPPPGLVPSCSDAGVLGILPGLIGTIQATEIIKLILGQGDSLIGRLLLVDTLDMEFRTLKLRKDPNCVICGINPTITELIDYDEFCGVLPARDALNGISEEETITIDEYIKLRNGERNFKLIDVRELHEREISLISEAIPIPKDEIENHVKEFEKDELLIFHCKTGIRSAKTIVKLKKLGFTNMKNLVGGINAYATQIDTTIPTY